MKKRYGLILVVVFFLFLENFTADGPEFVIEEENVEITVLEDSSLDIWYFLTIKTTLGPQRGIYFGIPKEDILDYSVTSGSTMLDVEKQGTKLKIYFPAVADSGDVTRLKIHLLVPEMVYKDEEGRVGVEFIPVYWDYQDVNILRVKFIAPEGVTKEELGCSPAPADNFGEENGRAFAYWERSLSEGQRLRYRISFPEGYVTNVVEKKSSEDNLYIEGGNLFNQKKYRNALEKFQQAKSIYEELENTEKVSICDTFITKCYKGINGDKYFSQAQEKEEEGDFEGAIKDYEAAKGFYLEIDQEKYELCKQKIEEVQKAFMIGGLTFPDKNLENAVLQYLGKNFVRKEDLVYVSEMDLSYKGIKSIENIGEYFLNLRYLDLSNNDISDISPISSLIKLEELNLSNNDISDISPLIANPNLQTGTKVNISNNPLSSKSVELYISILEGRGIELTWEPIKKVSITISFLKSKSFIYVLLLAAITISILAVYRITKKKPKKEVKKREFKEKLDQKKSKEIKIHEGERVESSELKQLLKERDELKSVLNGLKYHKERLVAEKMSEEKTNCIIKQLRS